MNQFMVESARLIRPDVGIAHVAHHARSDEGGFVGTKACSAASTLDGAWRLCGLVPSIIIRRMKEYCYMNQRIRASVLIGFGMLLGLLAPYAWGAVASQAQSSCQSFPQ